MDLNLAKRPQTLIGSPNDACDAEDGDEKQRREVISCFRIIYRGNHDKLSARAPNRVTSVKTVSPIGVDNLALIGRHMFTTLQQTTPHITF